MRTLLRIGVTVAFVLTVIGASLEALAVLGLLVVLDRIEARS